jgi:hypothetical protein
MFLHNFLRSLTASYVSEMLLYIGLCCWLWYKSRGTGENHLWHLYIRLCVVANCHVTDNWKFAYCQYGICIVTSDLKCSSVTVVTTLRVVQNFDSQQGQRISVFANAYIQTLGSTHSPIQWVLGPPSPGVKRPGREADPWPPSSAKVNVWSCTRLFPIHLHSAVLC